MSDEVDQLINTWLRGCTPAVQLSVADHERLRLSIVRALVQRESWLGADDKYRRFRSRSENIPDDDALPNVAFYRLGEGMGGNG